MINSALTRLTPQAHSVDSQAHSDASHSSASGMRLTVAVQCCVLGRLPGTGRSLTGCGVVRVVPGAGRWGQVELRWGHPAARDFLRIGRSPMVVQRRPGNYVPTDPWTVSPGRLCSTTSLSTQQPEQRRRSAERRAVVRCLSAHEYRASSRYLKEFCFVGVVSDLVGCWVLGWFKTQCTAIHQCKASMPRPGFYVVHSWVTIQAKWTDSTYEVSRGINSV
jgi:hypothetical protein